MFGEIKNRIQSGYNLRDVIELVDELRFRSQTEKHELSHLYEVKIKNMGNAGRNGGEYYTPRPLIRAMIQVVAPKIGERIYDGACGSAGFLCEAFDYLQRQPNLTGDFCLGECINQYRIVAPVVDVRLHAKTFGLRRNQRADALLQQVAHVAVKRPHTQFQLRAGR